MLLRNGIKQALRTPVRSVSLFLLTVLICAFLTVGINLNWVAVDNVELMRQEFSTIAVPSFKGSINKQGSLAVSAKESTNYRDIDARNFDRSFFENAAGVEEVVVHRQMGVLVNDGQLQVNVGGTPDDSNKHDVIIFTYKGKAPVTLGPHILVKDTMVNRNTITIDWSARGFDQCDYYHKGFTMVADLHATQYTRQWEDKYQALDVDEMWLENLEGKKTGAFVLIPGQSYIASGIWGLSGNIEGITPDGIMLAQFTICADEAHAPKQRLKLGFGFAREYVASPEHDTYPCILPYDETFWETEAGVYYQKAVEVCRVNGNAMTAVATPDLTLFAPFYNEGVYISEGRSFRAADYEQGRKVCLVSTLMATLNQWQIGDTIELTFFEAQYGYDGRTSSMVSYYEPMISVRNSETGMPVLQEKEIQMETDTYEIVGLYAGNVATSQLNTSLNYSLHEGLDRRVIIVPDRSVSITPEVSLSKYNTAILLDDEEVMYFMSDMEASGLMEQQFGKYQLSFDIYDQGYGNIKQSLRQLDIVSRLTLSLAAVAAIAIVILLAVLTVSQNKRQIATLRSLGVRKGQIPAAVLSGLLIMCLLGAAIGGFAGYQLSGRVAEYILETAQADQGDLSFTVTTADDEETKEEAYTIAIQSRPQAAVLAGGAVTLSLMLLSCALALLEAQKSPMLTLGAKE